MSGLVELDLQRNFGSPCLLAKVARQERGQYQKSGANHERTGILGCSGKVVLDRVESDKAQRYGGCRTVAVAHRRCDCHRVQEKIQRCPEPAAKTDHRHGEQGVTGGRHIAARDQPRVASELNLDHQVVDRCTEQNRVRRNLVVRRQMEESDGRRHKQQPEPSDGHQSPLGFEMRRQVGRPIPDPTRRRSAKL